MGLKSGLKMSAIALGLFLGLWIAPFFVSLILTNYNAGALEKAIVPGMPWSEVARALDASRKWSFLHFGSKDGRLCGSVFFKDGTYSFVAGGAMNQLGTVSGNSSSASFGTVTLPGKSDYLQNR